MAQSVSSITRSRAAHLPQTSHEQKRRTLLSLHRRATRHSFRTRQLHQAFNATFREEE